MIETPCFFLIKSNLQSFIWLVNFVYNFDFLQILCILTVFLTEIKDMTIPLLFLHVCCLW